MLAAADSSDMSIKHTALIVAAFCFGFALSMYAYALVLWNKFPLNAKMAVSNCDNTEAGSKTVNPNKMLFISCGGFLE